MARPRKGYVRPLHDVFKMIDMCGGDTSVCWLWQGTLAPRPIFCWNGKRLQARKVVYALRNGVHYKHAPRVTTTCGNDACCNPTHLIAEHGSIHKLLRAGDLDDDTIRKILQDH